MVFLLLPKIVIIFVFNKTSFAISIPQSVSEQLRLARGHSFCHVVLILSELAVGHKL